MHLSLADHRASKSVWGRESDPRRVRFPCSTATYAPDASATGVKDGQSSTPFPPDASPEKRAALERFFAKTRRLEGGCLLWLGALNSRGYGCCATGQKGRSALAHRWIYEQTVGPIPPGLTIDHLCRNRRCVEVAHMEVVTDRENILRGTSPTAKNARKTHCIHGHPLDGDNLIIKKDGRRQCRTCQRAHERAHWRRTHPTVVRNRKPAPLPTAVTGQEGSR